MQHISFTYWHEDKAYRGNINHEGIIEWDKSLGDEKILFDEIIDKAFGPTRSEKLNIAKQVLYEWYNDMDTDFGFSPWIENKLNKN